ncbi:MAG: rRNA maturation RNase YbeY [Micavibrio sp.]
MAAKYDADIDVTLADPAWTLSYLDVEQVARTAMEQALAMARWPKRIEGRAIEASIVLANDDLACVLNRTYRGIDKSTNVLSFASLDSDDPLPEEGPCPIGDIILAYQTVDRESQEQGKFFKEHFIHLVVHGTLHLLGYDHQTEDEANIMESLEIRILEKMNIQNPYIDNFSMA